MRWLREFFRPTLKCERLGHVEGFRQVRRGYTSSRFGVADSVTQSRAFCPRCKTSLGKWIEDRRRKIDSLSMPTDDWDRLEADGEFWESIGIRRMEGSK